MVRHMSQYERRRRGNARPGGLRGCPWRGNASLRQRDSRNWRDLKRTAYEPLSSFWLLQAWTAPSSHWVTKWSNRAGEGCMQASALASASTGRAESQAKTANRTREIRPSGMTTGASGTVAVHASGIASTIAGAPEIYPIRPLLGPGFSSLVPRAENPGPAGRQVMRALCARNGMKVAVEQFVGD